MLFPILLLSCLTFASAAMPSNFRQSRIVNGISTSAPQFPYIASLIAYNPQHRTSSYSFCGASLIHKAYPATLLTAAHCLINLKGELQADLYRSDADASQSLSNNYARYEALKYVIHQNYDHSEFDNDIALIFLDADLTHEYHLQTVSIDLESDCCDSKDLLVVVGYGTDYEGGPRTDTLEYAAKWFVDRDECNRMMTEYTVREYYGGVLEYNANSKWSWSFVTDNMICAMGTNVDSCQGDSGGPLIQFGTNRQIGIVSWGFGCNNGVPGIYTDLRAYHSWIYAQIDAISGKVAVEVASSNALPTQQPSSNLQIPFLPPNYTLTSSASEFVDHTQIYMILSFLVVFSLLALQVLL